MDSGGGKQIFPEPGDPRAYSVGGTAVRVEFTPGGPDARAALERYILALCGEGRRG